MTVFFPEGTEPDPGEPVLHNVFDDYGDEPDPTFQTTDHTYVLAPKGRYEFPDGYGFRAAGSSLEVLNQDGQVVMALAKGMWFAATASGSTFVLESTGDDD